VSPALVPLASSAASARPAIVTPRNTRRLAHGSARRQSVLPHALPSAPIAGLPAPSHRSTMGSLVKRGGTSPLTIIVGGLLALLAFGASGAAAARVLARRRPPTPPTPAIAEREELATLSEADLLLQGVDMDAELQRLLAHGEPAVPGDASHTR
jgi:hypothetical protein